MDVFFADMTEIVAENQPLAPYTSYGVGGAARWMARPRGVPELARLVRRCAEEDIPVFALGRGANLLVADDGVDGMVVRLDAPVFGQVDWPDAPAQGRDDRPVPVRAGGGADMQGLVSESVRRGLSGLEGLAGIPGRLGGVVRMNAGGRFGQIGQAVRELTVVDARGETQCLAPAEAGFGYRRSSLAGQIVCEVVLELVPGDAGEMGRRVRQIWDFKRRTQPMNERSAGCVFRNPPGGSAGELIDRAGLKGLAVGGARVSEVHANFIVVRPGATADDIFALIGRLRREVARRFGIELELEIEVWGRRRTRSPEPVA